MSLLSLPTESITQIIQAIQDRPTLLSIILSCKSLRIIAEPCLYSSLLFLESTRVRLLENALVIHPERRNYIRTLELRYSTKKFGTESAPIIDLCSLSNLNTFVSESPFCNSHSWHSQDTSWVGEMQSYLKCFELASLSSTSVAVQRPLDRLRSITLHWTATASKRYWEATPLSPIFLLPGLEILEISCVKIGQLSSVSGGAGMSAKIHPFTRQTNLKSLTITEGTISADSLKVILSLPQALQRLSYCETRYHHSDHSDVYATDDMNILNDALAQQSESLTHLNISKAATRTNICHLKLPDLKALISLRLGSFAEHTIIPWTLSYLIPPVLEVIELIELSHEHLRPDDIFSALQIDSLLTSAANRGAPFAVNLLGPRFSKKLCNNLLERFNKRVNSQVGPSNGRFASSELPFRLQFTQQVVRRFIPPYLYVEREPLGILYNYE